MILHRSPEIILFFKHDSVTLSLEQEAISTVGLVEILKKKIREDYPKVKSFGLSLIKEQVFEVQISTLSDMPWKI